MAKPNPIELQKALKGADYPADRESLASLAEKNGADSGLVDKISHLGQKEFTGPDQVEKAVFRDK
ncbi:MULTISPECIES: DUF2795 domain-containing protein [Streptomyces]|uniref:DUF2795 domain-containing protein n=1 Tax=Streptomyces lycii TaxID=2654337 RepID=A0ABQ7FL38_9ACTN|nr:MULTISPECIES: DUF2795 domain-containing protein [Streptomyces]KAF4408688.1 DUF2795 domain-containing protein [Streptomyces lycii]PGH47951.1 hypothetical protein CRI70_25730 [Streptomyces sp. Ru87]